MLGNFIRVSFYPNISDRREFECVFKGERSLNFFIEKYQCANGILNFNYDPWGHTNDSKGLPILGCSDESFDIVMKAIYPEIYENKERLFLVKNKILKGTRIA